MARPRRNRITLPPGYSRDKRTGVLTIDRDRIRANEEASLKRATPERLGKALHAVNEDRVQRVFDEPLDALCVRRKLDSRDSKRNAILYEAGHRYRLHHHNAGLTGVGAMDFSRSGGSDGNVAYSIPVSEFAAHHRSVIRNADAVLGAYLRQWLHAIVIDGRQPFEVGRESTRYTDKETATAIALEVLRAGLTTLAQHWGMLR